MTTWVWRRTQPWTTKRCKVSKATASLVLACQPSSARWMPSTCCKRPRTTWWRMPAKLKAKRRPVLWPTSTRISSTRSSQWSRLKRSQKRSFTTTRRRKKLLRWTPLIIIRKRLAGTLISIPLRIDRRKTWTWDPEKSALIAESSTKL